MGKILWTMTTLAWLTMAPAAVYAQASMTGTVRDASALIIARVDLAPLVNLRASYR